MIGMPPLKNFGRKISRNTQTKSSNRWWWAFTLFVCVAAQDIITPDSP
jgi:hypothetical protein